MDELLLNKLSRICSAEGDFSNAKRFALASPAPDFPRCFRCEAPLIGGETSQVKIRKGFKPTLACNVCLEPRACELRKDKKKKIQKAKEEPKPVVEAVMPAITPKKPNTPAAAAPQTLLGMAEKRMREEKKSARKSLKMTAPPPAPAQNSLSAVAKLLMG